MRRGQFDGKRYSVELSTDRRDRVSAGLIGYDRGFDACRSVPEQLGGRDCIEGCHVKDAFAGNGERLSAGRQHLHVLDSADHVDCPLSEE